jgi:lipoate---protein ligase
MPTVAEDLALDEALLEAAETTPSPSECLRLWEPASAAVVVGRSSRFSAEVNLANCQADGVPIVRRTSGGAAIVAGPGCLMYSLVLSLELRPELRDVSVAHRFVLDRTIAAIGQFVPGVKCRGTSDLVIGDKKISGNSLRQRRRNLLYHGTLLYDFPLETISRYLIMPPRMPDYRAARPHGDFVVNLAMKGAELRRTLAETWAADSEYPQPPLATARQLALEKYATASWNEQLK